MGNFIRHLQKMLNTLLGLWTKWICLTVCLDFLVLMIHF